MVGHHVTGKKLGIVGMGKVGQVMAKRARGFEMEIHYHNRNQLDPEKEQGAIFHSDIDQLFAVVDYISLHCPATDQTRGMIDQQALEKMKTGVILINTARGALINEDDLLLALEAEKVAAAGLDCFATEPGGNAAFSNHENIFMLPHIGSATFETRDAMGFRALDNLDAYFAGKAPRDRVA